MNGTNSSNTAEFFDLIKDTRNVLRVTIPLKLAKIKGFKGGDKVRVILEKIEG